MMPTTDLEKLFSQVEEYESPSTILFRSIELRLLKERFRDFLAYSPSLDLGCGDGLAAKVVFEKPVDFGLDVNPLSLKEAERRVVFRKTVLAHAEDTQLEDKSLKLVFANCVIEHIPNLKAVLKEVYRVLSPGGVFIATAPSQYFKDYSVLGAIGPKRLSGLYGRLRNKKLSHHHCLSLPEWKTILQEHGLELLDGYYYINEKDMRLWDCLFLLNPVFTLLKKLNPSLNIWIYEKLFRSLIYKRFLGALPLSDRGGAVSFVAQKK